MSATPSDTATTGLGAKLVGAWAFVGIPLAYGIVMTVKKALPLFGG